MGGVRGTEAVAAFDRLSVAAGVSNLGDGALLAAAPLLVVSMTSSPTLVGASVAVQHLPWLLFALVSGAYVDRADRRRTIIAVDLLRAIVIGGLAAAIWLDVVTLALVYVALFALATAETVADTASTSLLPDLVPPEGLAAANGRLSTLQIIGNRLAGPPLGAWLFTTSGGAPFAFDALTFLVAGALVATIRTPRRTALRSGLPLRQDVVEGLRWLWRHHGLRTLAVCLCLMNVIFMAPFAVLPLFAREELGVGPFGFGLLLIATAIGGVVGSALVGRLESAVGSWTILRAGLVIETATHALLALADSALFAGVVLGIFGIHAATWGIVVVSLRQRVVPDRLRGRVNSAYMLLSAGGAAVGSAVGGPVAAVLGLRSPFWLAFAAMAVLTVLWWPRIGPVAFATDG